MQRVMMGGAALAGGFAAQRFLSRVSEEHSLVSEEARGSYSARVIRAAVAGFFTERAQLVMQMPSRQYCERKEKSPKDDWKATTKPDETSYALRALRYAHSPGGSAVYSVQNEGGRITYPFHGGIRSLDSIEPWRNIFSGNSIRCFKTFTSEGDASVVLTGTTDPSKCVDFFEQLLADTVRLMKINPFLERRYMHPLEEHRLFKCEILVHETLETPEAAKRNLRSVSRSFVRTAELEKDGKPNFVVCIKGGKMKRDAVVLGTQDNQVCSKLST
ncbi:MAG: hypothetical protein MRY21_07925 [Simkaniaceae bacterium]|nr:hypothetical protein [Simkaniaceae bacterium]